VIAPCGVAGLGKETTLTFVPRLAWRDHRNNAAVIYGNHALFAAPFTEILGEFA